MILLAEASPRNRSMAAGHQSLVTRSVNEGTTVPARSLIHIGNTHDLPRGSIAALLFHGRRPSIIGNPKCQRGSYSTRAIVFDSVRNSREGRVSNAHTRKFKALEPGSNGVMVGFLFTMERVLKCFPDGLGYHDRQDLSVPSAGFGKTGSVEGFQSFLWCLYAWNILKNQKKKRLAF